MLSEVTCFGAAAFLAGAFFTDPLTGLPAFLLGEADLGEAPLAGFGEAVPVLGEAVVLPALGEGALALGDTGILIGLRPEGFFGDAGLGAGTLARAFAFFLGFAALLAFFGAAFLAAFFGPLLLLLLFTVFFAGFFTSFVADFTALGLLADLPPSDFLMDFLRSEESL